MSSVTSRASVGLRPLLRLRCRSANGKSFAESWPRTLRHASTTEDQPDPAAVLSRPTWSVRSLLPDDKATTSSSEQARITPKQLHHLLRLSALPLPKTSEEETKMVEILQSQLRFVRDVQSVDTRGVDPLRSIRDETDQGLQEATIGVEQVRHVLSQEVAFGRSKRPRRQKLTEKAPAEVENWNPLQTASDTAGPYFVVRSGRNHGR